MKKEESLRFLREILREHPPRVSIKVLNGELVVDGGGDAAAKAALPAVVNTTLPLASYNGAAQLSYSFLGEGLLNTRDSSSPVTQLCKAATREMCGAALQYLAFGYRIAFMELFSGRLFRTVGARAIEAITPAD